MLKIKIGRKKNVHFCWNLCFFPIFFHYLGVYILKRDLVKNLRDRDRDFKNERDGTRDRESRKSPGPGKIPVAQKTRDRDRESRKSPAGVPVPRSLLLREVK